MFLMNKQKSFTLIELLVVIVIIGILAGVIIVSVSSSINKANFAKAQSFSNTVQNELLGDLVSEWTFDIASNPGEDTWGNNDGIIYGSPYYNNKASGNCVYGGCYSFNGTTDYINIDNPILGETEMSVCAWAKKTAYVQYQGIVSDYIPGSSRKNFILGYESPENTLYFYVGDGVSTASISNGGFTPNQWHFVCGTFKGGNAMSLYIDGIGKSKSISITNIGTTQSAQSSIGKYDSIFLFNGFIDDVRIYEASLSSAQIKKQYVAGLNSLYSKGIISKSEFNDRISGK